MPKTTKQYELSLEQRIQRVRDAWFSDYESDDIWADIPWPVYVYEDRIIVEAPDGFRAVPYTVSADGITFGEGQKVEQEFVAARHPVVGSLARPNDGRGLTDVAQDFVRATARLFGFQGSTPHGSGSGSFSPGLAPVGGDGEGWLLQSPFRVYSDDDERYVGGLVLDPGDDNAYGDIWEAEDIRLMAYRFMEESRHIDFMHTTKVVAQPVESFYFPTEEEGGQSEYTLYGETIPAGSWWLGSRVQDDEAWEMVKSGELTGYSMFAVKLAHIETEANRAYQTALEEAPGGKKMSADEWDITMVALVDKPAVTKATYVIMRRAPDGQAQISPAPNRGRKPAQGELPMRKINRIAAYHEDQTPPTGTTGAEDEAQQTPPANEGEQAGEPTETPGLADSIKAMFVEQMEALKEQFQGMIDTSLQPLKDSVTTLETRQARFSGAGALPGSILGSGEEREEVVTPDWVNYGTRPRRVEAGAGKGQN